MKNIFFSFLVLLASCNNNKNNSNANNVLADSNTASKNNQPEFSGVDSIEVYFYADPRNQKEFTRTKITNESLTTVLVANLERQTTAMKECPHNGKIFFFRKGDVFKTVYISTVDTCRYFAYAINATPHFVAMNDSSYRLISTLESQAR
jgi:hypothetical protein